MLFFKKIEPRCDYCERGTLLSGQKVLCIKKGITKPEGHCRKFRYDPLKRIPARPTVPDFSRLNNNDFTL
jgi:hypothetical protein